MKAIMIISLAFLSLSMGIANAGTVQQQGETQYNLTAGAAGWG